MLISERAGAGRRCYQFAFCIKTNVRPQAEVIVVVVRNSFPKNELEHDIVLARPPRAGERATKSVNVVLEIRQERARYNASYGAREECEVEMAMLVFIAIKSD